MSVEIPNPAIRLWKDEYDKYKNLQSWHKDVFLKKIEDLRAGVPEQEQRLFDEEVADYIES